jgi:hypothetical protein
MCELFTGIVNFDAKRLFFSTLRLKNNFKFQVMKNCKSWHTF